MLGTLKSYYGVREGSASICDSFPLALGASNLN